MRWRSSALLAVAPAVALAVLQLAADRPVTPDDPAVIAAGSPSASPTIDGSVPPTGTAPETRPPSIDERGRLALQQISYPWASGLETWDIVFSPGRDGILGLTYVDDEVIEVFVRDDQTIDMIAHVIAHEMGHAVDVTHLDGEQRRRWQQARSIDSAPWRPESGVTDFAAGAGDFAESFASWQIGSTAFRGELAGPPDANQLDLLAELVLS